MLPTNLTDTFFVVSIVSPVGTLVRSRVNTSPGVVEAFAAVLNALRFVK